MRYCIGRFIIISLQLYVCNYSSLQCNDSLSIYLDFSPSSNKIRQRFPFRASILFIFFDWSMDKNVQNEQTFPPQMLTNRDRYQTNPDVSFVGATCLWWYTFGPFSFLLFVIKIIMIWIGGLYGGYVYSFSINKHMIRLWYD